MEETTFFNEGGLTVTNSRFVVPGQTYAMSGVTSIRTEEYPHPGNGQASSLESGYYLYLVGKTRLLLLLFSLRLALCGGVHRKQRTT